MLERRTYSRQHSLELDELQGIYVPVLTPGKSTEKGFQIDTESQKKHLRVLTTADSGVSGIFLGSNAGGGPKMSMENLKCSIANGLKFCRQYNPQIPVVVGALRERLSEVQEIVLFASEMGADGIVIAPGQCDAGPEKTLQTVCDIKPKDKPLVLYNNPHDLSHDVKLDKNFLLQAAKDGLYIGIKDTSRDPVYFSWLLENLQPLNIHVLQGDTKAGLLPDIRQAQGMVAVEANLKQYAQILAGIMNPKCVFDSSALSFVLTDIGNKKAEFGGTLKYMKHLLVKNGIFQFSD